MRRLRKRQSNISEASTEEKNKNKNIKPSDFQFFIVIRNNPNNKISIKYKFLVYIESYNITKAMAAEAKLTDRYFYNLFFFVSIYTFIYFAIFKWITPMICDCRMHIREKKAFTLTQIT